MTLAVLLTGLAVFTLMILREEWRVMVRAATTAATDSFGHAHREYPHAKPFTYNPKPQRHR